MQIVKEAVKPKRVPLCELKPGEYFILADTLYQVTNIIPMVKGERPVCCRSFDEHQLNNRFMGNTVVQHVEIKILVTELEADED